MRDVDRIDFDKRIQSYGIHLLACYIVNLVYLSQNVLSCQIGGVFFVYMGVGWDGF